MVKKFVLVVITLFVCAELSRAFLLQLIIVKTLEAAKNAKSPSVRRVGETKQAGKLRIANQIIKTELDRHYPKSDYKCHLSVPCFDWQVDRTFIIIRGRIRWFLLFEFDIERSLETHILR